jgi:hypothetical protein
MDTREMCESVGCAVESSAELVLLRFLNCVFLVDDEDDASPNPQEVSYGDGRVQSAGYAVLAKCGIAPSNSSNTGDQWPFNGNLIPGTHPQDGVCTTGPLSGPMNSDPLVLACCQAHDNCYAQHQCNASSWIPVMTGSCTVCNLKAVACIKQAVLPVVPPIP